MNFYQQEPVVERLYAQGKRLRTAWYRRNIARWAWS